MPKVRWWHKTWLQGGRRTGRFWGSSTAPTTWSLGLWAACGEELCYQRWLWISSMVGFVLGYLRQPCCRFSCTEQSTSCLILTFGKLCSACIILEVKSLFSNSNLNLFMAGLCCFIFLFLLQREPSFCSSSKANFFLSRERGHLTDLFLPYSTLT